MCCNSWHRKESDTTEWLNWTEHILQGSKIKLWRHWEKKFWGCILDELYWKKQIFFSTSKKSRNHKRFAFLFIFPYILGPYIGLSILQPDPAAAIIWFWFNWNVCLQLLGVYACRALVSACAFGLKVHIHTIIIIVFSVAARTSIIFTTP